MSASHPKETFGGSAFSRTRRSLKIDLLGKLQSVIDLIAQVPVLAFQLAVPEEQLAGAEVSGLLVDECHLGSSQTVATIRTRLTPVIRPSWRAAAEGDPAKSVV